MSKRNARSNSVSETLEGFAGWDRDPHRCGAAAEWRYRFPGLPMVADGRKETGNTRAGRGTTAFDLFRTVVEGAFIRTDMLSIKTETIGSSGQLPSKLSLSTGNLQTIQSLIDGIECGAALPTVIFASKNGVNGPEDQGLALFLDIGEVIRTHGIQFAPEGGYKKGHAPPVYFKWSSSRKCGGKHKLVARSGFEFPHVDEQGRKWVSADRVCYRELVVSLSALGYKRTSWLSMNIVNLPGLVESQNWRKMSQGL